MRMFQLSKEANECKETEKGGKKNKKTGSVTAFPVSMDSKTNDERIVSERESEFFPGKPWFYTAQIELRIVVLSEISFPYIQLTTILIKNRFILEIFFQTFRK